MRSRTSPDGVALHVQLGVLEVRLVLRQLGVGLIECCLVRPRVDHRDQVAGLDHLAPRSPAPAAACRPPGRAPAPSSAPAPARGRADTRSKSLALGGRRGDRNAAARRLGARSGGRHGRASRARPAPRPAIHAIDLIAAGASARCRLAIPKTPICNQPPDEAHRGPKPPDTDMTHRSNAHTASRHAFLYPACYKPGDKFRHAACIAHIPRISGRSPDIKLRRGALQIGGSPSAGAEPVRSGRRRRAAAGGAAPRRARCG